MGLSVSPHYAHDILVQPTRTPERRVIFLDLCCTNTVIRVSYKYTSIHSVVVKHLLFAAAVLRPPLLQSWRQRSELKFTTLARR